MSADAALMSKSWKVGSRTVTMTVPKPRTGELAMVAMEWHPEMPAKLNRRELQQYRTGRDGAIAEFASTLGINVVVVEA